MEETSCIKAYHQMEERYSSLVLTYNSIEKKNEIFLKINELVELHGITPSITISPSKVGTGEYSIEFHDDYQKKAGGFFDVLLKDLCIEICE